MLPASDERMMKKNRKNMRKEKYFSRIFSSRFVGINTKKRKKKEHSASFEMNSNQNIPHDERMRKNIR